MPMPFTGPLSNLCVCVCAVSKTTSAKDTIRACTTDAKPICKFEFKPRKGVVFKAAYSRTHGAIFPIKGNGAIDYSKKYGTPRSFAQSTGEKAGSIKRVMWVNGVNLIQIEANCRGEHTHTLT
jgi:hypothetical protein